MVADVTGDATIALAALTFVLAIAAIVSSALTYRALGAARRDTLEATKARIDQQAPRVTVVALMPAAPCSWSGASSPVLLTHGESVAAGAYVGIAGWFTIRNDGNSGGVVEVPPGVFPLPETIPLPSNLGSIGTGRPIAPIQFPILPGQQWNLLVWAGRSTQEWREQLAIPAAERQPYRVTLKVDDTFAEGISDSTDLLLQGIPVHLSGRDLLAGQAEVTVLIVDRTRRTYPNLS